MANSSSKNDLTWEVDNKFIQKYILNDLKWYKEDGFDTWYLKNKCEEFINNTDTYFTNFKIANVDLIKNDVSKENKKQYQTLDYDEIKHYPPHLQEQICSSIFRNAHRKDMHIPKQTIDEHFENKKVCTRRGRFIKIIRDDMYAQTRPFYIRILYLYF